MKAFKVFDKEEIGFINSSELRCMLSMKGDKLSNDKMNLFIRMSDLIKTVWSIMKNLRELCLNIYDLHQKKRRLTQKEDETDSRSCSQLDKWNKLEIALERTEHSYHTFYIAFVLFYLVLFLLYIIFCEKMSSV